MRSATSNRLGAALAAAGALWACAGDPPDSILLVTLDTLRRDHVGAYGGAGGLTPHLDALAAEGLVHDAAFTTMPTTGPAHLSLFTGLLPSEHGARANAETLAEPLVDRELGVLLRRRGWATAGFVTTRLVSAPATGLRGFEVYDAPSGALRHGTDVVDAALAWLEVERRRPLLLWVHIYDPHSPYGTADEKRLAFPVEASRYGWVDPAHYDTPEERRAMAERYARGVRAADAALGRLLAGARAVLGDPLVIVAADHGELLDDQLDRRGFAYDHGEFLDRETIAIPLVLAGPGIPPGRSAGAASIRDLYTTILEAAGAGDPRAAAEGRRDLRRAQPPGRTVRVERRRFLRSVPEAVRAHAAAASDGPRLAIVAEDGAVTSGGEDGALVAQARRSLGAAPHAAGAPSLDAATQRALRDLGYAE